MSKTTAEVWNPIPEDIRDCDLMILAWRDCLMWAAGFSPIKEQYAAETGTPIQVARGGIIGLVDKATGFEAAEMRRFIEWFNVNVWGGIEDGPDDLPFDVTLDGDL